MIGVRSRAIDVLRGVSALLVFATHADSRRFPGGFLGVDLFFVLSAFLITRIIRTEQLLTGAVNLSYFLTRRAARLIPALLPVVVVCAIAQSEIPLPHASTDALISVLFVTDVNAGFQAHASLLLHTWSLGVEAQFYAAWSVLLALTPSRKLVLLMIGVCSVIGVGSSYALVRAGAATAYLPMGHTLPIAAGAAVAVALETQAGRQVVHVIGSPLLVMCASAVLAYGVLKVDQLPLRVGQLEIAAVGGILLAGALRRATTFHRRGRFLDAIAWLGRRSYAFYLWHYPILSELGLHGLRFWPRIVGGFALSLLVTSLSWRLVELPIQARRQKLPANMMPSVRLSGLDTSGTGTG